MVNEILRERDHAGFGDRNEYGSRMGGGGGIDVSAPFYFSLAKNRCTTLFNKRLGRMCELRMHVEHDCN